MVQFHTFNRTSFISPTGQFHSRRIKFAVTAKTPLSPQGTQTRGSFSFERKKKKKKNQGNFTILLKKKKKHTAHMTFYQTHINSPLLLYLLFVSHESLAPSALKPYFIALTFSSFPFLSSFNQISKKKKLKKLSFQILSYFLK